MIDVIVNKDALTLILYVPIIVLVLMIVVIHHLAVFSLQSLVLMGILVLMILVALFRDVYTPKKFVTTIIFVPPILAMLKLVFVIIPQQTVTIKTHVLLMNVV
jgi:O-antigen ligase